MSTREDPHTTDATDGSATYAALAGRAAAAPSLSLRDLARTQGLDLAALARLVSAHAHVTPTRWLERMRIEHAARLLLSSRKAPTSIAEEVGFARPEAFTRAFLRHSCMSPEAYRGLRKDNAFELELPRHYRSAEVLAYHGRDPQGVSERVTGQRILKALRLPSVSAVVEINLGARSARCRVHVTATMGATDLQAVHRTVLRMLGLYLNVRAFERLASRDARLKPLIAKRRGLRLALCASVFDSLCWAITGQQINVPFASQLRRALIELAGRPIGDMRAHPVPADIAALDITELRSLRFSRAKAEYLIGTAGAVADGELDVEALSHGSAIAGERALTQRRGIGPWTARYVLMRGAGFADCVPIGDAALSAALQRLAGATKRPTPQQTAAFMEGFSPYRSLATAHLWASLGG